jgi:molybdopterin-guanine dinucleotide biosynthesis protein A
MSIVSRSAGKKPMLSLSIQAGGQSSRMGRDKALMGFLGQPLIQHVHQRVEFLAEDIFITSNRPDDYEFLNIPIFTDIIPGIGALGGIFTALKSSKQHVVGVIACDLPFINPDLLSYCKDILVDSSVDVVIPRTEHGLEPLHAIYRVETCSPLVEAAINAGNRKAISWHAEAKIHIIPPEEIFQFDPHGIAFWNVNTPADFRKAEKKALELSFFKSG